MAVSISFGLAYATILILFVIPALISLIEERAEKKANRKTEKLGMQEA
jgi:predicted RND superfamily exporter protein